MKKIMLMIIAISLLHINSGAQTTVKKDAIKELFAIMHQDSLITKSMREMSMMMAGNLKNSGLSDSASKNDTKKIMEKQMAATEMMVTRLVNEDMVNIYDKHFTLEEIKDFTNFYKSKSGQQWLNKTPEITRDLIMIMSSKYLPEIQKSVKETEKTN